MPDISTTHFMEQFVDYYDSLNITPSTKKNTKNTFKGKAFDELIKRPCLCPTMTYMKKDPCSKSLSVLLTLSIFFYRTFEILKIKNYEKLFRKY